MVFHSKVFTIAREFVFRERLGKEVSRVELGADVPNANRKISNVVTDLEIARIKMFGSLKAFSAILAKSGCVENELLRGAA